MDNMFDLTMLQKTRTAIVARRLRLDGGPKRELFSVVSRLERKRGDS
jgi:hypothetical protein